MLLSGYGINIILKASEFRDPSLDVYYEFFIYWWIHFNERVITSYRVRCLDHQWSALSPYKHLTSLCVHA